MIPKIFPLWKNPPLGMWVALDHNYKIIAQGINAEEAEMNASAKKRKCANIAFGSDLQRPALLPAEVHKQPLVLVAHDWKNGRPFFIKEVEFKDEDLALIHGAYLDDIFIKPWVILPDKTFLSSIRIRKKPYVGIGSSKKDNTWYAYEPTVEELKKYLETIRYYIKNDILTKAVSNSINWNHDIKEAFKRLLRVIR